MGMQLRPLIESFQGKVHAARWGTIVFATHQLLQLERPLRWGWSLALFLGPSASEGSDQAVKAKAVDEAVSSEFWWACLKVLDRLHKAVRHMFAWSEACSCHGFVSPDCPRDQRDKCWGKVCEGCPLRGRRCPDMACGDFLQELRAHLDTSAAELVLDMSPNLNPEQQALLLNEFEKGRASLLFNIALKVSAFTVPPLLIFGVGHLDSQKARAALRSCLASENNERLMAELKSSHVLAEAHAFLHGECLSELPHMTRLVCKLRFAFSVERTVEGEHAQIHHFIRKAPRHTVAYVSLNRRLPQLKANIADPAFFKRLSATLETLRNPKLVVHELGLARHPGCVDVAHTWDPIYGKIVYRSDPLTTQGLNAPVAVRPLPGGGRSRKQPLAIKDGEGEAAVAGSYQALLLHEAALEHFKMKLHATCLDNDGRDHAFSMYVSDTTLSALLDLPDVPPPDSVAEPPAAIADTSVDAAVVVPAHSGHTGPGASSDTGVGGLVLGDLGDSQKPSNRLEEVFQDAIAQLKKPQSPDPNLPKSFAFKIVSLNPAQSKVPLQDAFASTDVAVSLLRSVRLDASSRS